VAALAKENISEGLTRTDRSGRRFSGRSKQRPYGILVWQYASGSKAGASSRTPQKRGDA